MAKKRSLIQRLPLAPVFAVMFGAAAAVLVAATPQWLFDATFVSSGVAGMVPVVQPPLGIKARLLAVVAVFVLIAVAVWLVGIGIERLLSAARAPKVVDDNDALDLAEFTPVPLLETPRRPIFADRELGAPLMSDEALATAATFAEPFPAFDPSLFDEEPVEDELFATHVRDEALVSGPETLDAKNDDSALQAPLAIEEFDVPRESVEAETLPGESSIDALIRRLEAGLARRAGPIPPHPGSPVMTAPVTNPRDWMVREVDAASFDEDATRALGTLRRMVG